MILHACDEKGDWRPVRVRTEVLSGKGAIARLIENRLRWLKGEWWENPEQGLDVLEEYGVRNPYRDMIDNDRVLLVDNHIGETLRYLQAYYAPDVKAEEVRKYGQIRVYRIVTEGA